MVYDLVCLIATILQMHRAHINWAPAWNETKWNEEQVHEMQYTE